VNIPSLLLLVLKYLRNSLIKSLHILKSQYKQLLFKLGGQPPWKED